MDIEDVKDLNQGSVTEDDTVCIVYIDFKNGSKLEFTATEHPMVGALISDELMVDANGDYMESPYTHEELNDVITDWYEAGN